MLEAFFDLLVPLVMAAVIDEAIPAGDSAGIGLGCAGMVALGIVGLVCSLIAQYFAARAATGFSAKVRRALFVHVQSLSPAQLDGLSPAALITRMTADVDRVQNGINMALRLFLRSPFIVLGALVLSCFIDLKCALIFALTIPVLFAIVFGVMAITRGGYRSVQDQLDGVASITRENLTGVRVIRAFHREEQERQRFHSANAGLAQKQIRVGDLSNLMNPLTYVVVDLAIVAILHFGGVSVNTGTLRTGDIIALVNYMGQVLIELVKLANTVVLFSRCTASARRIADVLGTASDARSGSAAPTVGDTAVTFDNVSLTYPGSERPALEGLSFSVRTGQTVGIIGSTGSGKSSLVRLIPGLYEATQGRVEVFGTDVRQWDPKALHRCVAIVPQHAVLFSGTIRSNLTFGKPDADDAQLWQALKLAQAGFVTDLDAVVEQGGVNFSGGQRQRLTIARALVCQSPILILDDSASALDLATDAALRRALQSLPWHPTIFLVSQRFHSLRHADAILVLEDGAAVDMGTHEALLERCSVYREICDSQQQKGGGRHG